ncbi:hypothetical protein CEUSTIGMA_g6598.t1 [Chlamydomonas eustigma]|uniref:CBM20 domain-containing protein n=1 Tax=Chlamydomonas eustigma TaxID=1157962 RepID=A0A250X7U8_9CHLO|nr:hypothetical protein CEUSTIGMA_g6598.t1 [Chlamydomonas eustigma]|eukprot:GAX79158.1 hypothetical protein CEUSTIGMA_g6598.t1 [Chlamydomonas eustigma]
MISSRRSFQDSRHCSHKAHSHRKHVRLNFLRECLRNVRGGAASKIRFVVPYYETQMGQKLKVVGNIPELGSWQVDSAPDMTWSEGHVWTLESFISAPSVEFKIVVESPNNVLNWEDGCNRVLQVVDMSALEVQCLFGITSQMEIKGSGPEEGPAMTSTEPVLSFEASSSLDLPPQELIALESPSGASSEPLPTPEEVSFASSEPFPIMEEISSIFTEEEPTVEVVNSAQQQSGMVMDHPVMTQELAYSTPTDPADLNTVLEVAENVEELAGAELHDTLFHSEFHSERHPPDRAVDVEELESAIPVAEVQEEPPVSELESVPHVAEVVEEPAIVDVESVSSVAEAHEEPPVSELESVPHVAEVVEEPAVVEQKSVPRPVAEVEEEPAVDELESVTPVTEVEEEPTVEELKSALPVAEVVEEPAAGAELLQSVLLASAGNGKAVKSGISGALDLSLQSEAVIPEAVPAAIVDPQLEERKQIVISVNKELESPTMRDDELQQLNHLRSVSDPSQIIQNGVAASPDSDIAASPVTEDASEMNLAPAVVQAPPPKEEKFVVLSTERGKIILMKYDS